MELRFDCNDRDLVRLRIVRRLLEQKAGLSAPEAARMLGCSVRQVFRLKAKIKAEGDVGIIHGNRGRRSHNAGPASLRKRVLTLYQRHFYDFNFAHFTEALVEEYGIVLSRETVRCWLRTQDLGPHRRRRSSHHRRRRERKAQFGELLFLDGSPHHWLGDERPPLVLILATDDATGKPLHGLFAAQETLSACFEVFYRVACSYGLPKAFYLDRAGQFTTTRHGGVHVLQRDDKPTHFEIAMQTLAVELIFAHSPQARGRGERINGSFQGRLVAELRHQDIEDISAATAYLNRVFIPKYARRFGIAPRDSKAAFRPIPRNIDLHHVLCAKHVRTVANDDTISFNSHCYQLLLANRRICLVGEKVTVEEWFDNSIHVLHHRTGDIPFRRTRDT